MLDVVVGRARAMVKEDCTIFQEKVEEIQVWGEQSVRHVESEMLLRQPRVYYEGGTIPILPPYTQDN